VRPYQVATAAAVVLIAAVAMFDSRNAFNPSTGTAPGDVGSRWYPFWAATIMGVSAVVVAYRSLTTPQAGEGIFQRRESVFAVSKLVLPMLTYVTIIRGIGWKDSATDIVYTVIPPLGFYIATALYMGGFAWWIGRYRVWWVALILVAFPIVIFVVFEIGFRVTLPKSFLYDNGVLPF
jgi:putative tricarboxylic transport membrane protein